MRFTDKETALLKILLDPVLWVESTVRNPDPGKGDELIKLRWHQKKFLRSDSRRIVLRMGRRVGKTLSMALKMLHYAFTHKDSTQLLATPYETQIQEVYDTLLGLISASPELQDSLSRCTRSPYLISFKNGARIMGKTAGTKSKAEGASFRGLKADILYFDEADYLGDKDFEAIYAIASANPDIKVIAASTPTGRRGKFWQYCTGVIPDWEEHYAWAGMENPDWKVGMPEHLRFANPRWTAEMEKEMRASYSQEGYQHEIMAEFGEELVGVFNKEFIDRSRREYSYHEIAYFPSVRIMGVDWDKYNAATQIIVMEYNFNYDGLGRFQIINRAEIPRSEFTLDNAVKKIIQMNELFDPQHIYVDRGYGEYQVETLHKYGLDHPETGLHKKVKGIAFSQSKDVIDPATKLIERKAIKPFMVDQLCILFERDKIIISEYDEVIIRQLENYRVVKRSTTTGAPTFTDEDEHTIDGICLCTLGFVENYPEYVNTLVAANYAHSMGTIKVMTREILLDQELNRGKTYLDPVQNKMTNAWDEPGSPPLKKVPVGSKPKRNELFSWSKRGTNTIKPIGRSLW